MTDRVYPSSKPKGTTTTAASAANGTTNGTTNRTTNGTTNGTTNRTTNGTTNRTINPRLPPTKSQLYNRNLHPYRPQPTTNNRHHRRRRRCLCLCCFWSILFITTILLLAAIGGCILYVLYRPHRPTFSISAIKISQFNLTTAADDFTTHLTSKLNLTISTKNPNKKLIFFYDSFSITSLSNQVQIANGSFPNFTSIPNNITIIRSSLYSNSLFLETESVKSIRSDLKRKFGLPLKILMDTEVRVKIDSLKSKKVGIRITCDGIHSLVPKGKSPSSVAATISNAKCKVDLRIKIWKWTF